MKKASLLTSLSCFFFSLHVFAGVPSLPDVHLANAEIADRLLNVMGGCGEKIWPGYSWTHLNIVLIDDENAAKQTAVSVSEKKIFAVESNKLPAAALKTAYFFFELPAGTKWMSINTALDLKRRPLQTYSDLVKENFRLAIHEGFHYIGQKNWNIYEGNRGTELPIRWEPRLYRSMLFDSLKNALLYESKSADYLAKARYWYDRWTTEYPQEAASTADGYEGSARYADWIGYALSDLGCATTEAKIQSYVRPLLDTHFGFAVSGDLFAFDAEGYEIGALSAFLLRRDYSSEEWTARMMKGQSPVSILLEKSNPISDEIAPEKKDKFIQAGNRFQKEAEEVVGETPRLLNQSASVFVSVPDSWYAGSFSPLGFYIDTKTGAQLIPMAMPLEFKSDDSILSSRIKAVFLDNVNSPCSSPHAWQFVLPAESVLMKSDKLEISHTFFNGVLVGKKALSSTGKYWFCAGESLITQ